MKINNHCTSATNHNNRQNRTANPSFGNNIARNTFEKLGDLCNAQSNGSLNRWTFLFVGTVFMLGGRFIESRNKDEKREVLTRDIPGVTLAAFGAPAINDPVARLITKRSGIPIVYKNGVYSGFWRNGKDKFEFASQKQIKDWYSEFSKLDNPLVNFVKTINNNNGNIAKSMKKLGFEKELKAITSATDNDAIMKAINEAKSNKTDAFVKLEDSLKKVGADNPLLKFAKESHAYLKIGAILVTAALLGYLIPRLNILITRNKYIDPKGTKGVKNDAAAGQAEQPKAELANSGIHFHNKTSTSQAFKSFHQFL